MINNNFLGCFDNNVSNDTCDRLIEAYEEINNTNTGLPKKSFEINNKERRCDKAVFLSGWKDTYINLINDFNNELTNSLVKYAENFPVLQNLNYASFEIKIQKTKLGQGFHSWHCEQDDYHSATRMLVWTVYLNDIDKGGETEFLYQSERIKAKKGRVVFFPANWTHIHRGNPPLSETKYIATGWYNFT
tara:strand:- start:600 stop:1166 length:567 start_codon:yes stop_codon:yes gene_type:complete